MNTRRSGLKRLANLYRLVNEVHALELGVASAALAQVEKAAQDTAQAQSFQTRLANSALDAGDNAAWACAQASRKITDLRTCRLDALRLEHLASREGALRKHQESSIQMEQMNCAADRTRMQLDKQADRNAQNEGDDRFLSRREWIRSEARRLASSRAVE